ncbi:hypothetical protein LGK97_15100 [Clostridium sp. CS001]|uniref:hypothetical protein n=1 Tax=Clostridium sp. CS001 TaxID=2880648 RepID=UPI001CF19D48|nr:hypothetical protein [Clostridium sp. CS001]MCB2291062.1 hypothetical protein [Clostridium sp. CS001]
MKYMSFNNSCSYAGIANLLLDYSIDIEDYQVAIETKVPYIFRYDEHWKRYVSGSMLQADRYFNFYLQNLSLQLVGNEFTKESALDFLKKLQCRAMIGLNVSNGRKHAVIYSGVEADKYIFMNNKRKDSQEPDFYRFSFNELLYKMDETVFISYLENRLGGVKIDLTPEIKDSFFYLQEYKENVAGFCSEVQGVDALNKGMSTLFHAFFLDVYSMMVIIGEKQLSEGIGDLRNSYLQAMRLKQPLRLSEYISIEYFKKAIDEYKKIIHIRVIDGF